MKSRLFVTALALTGLAIIDAQDASAQTQELYRTEVASVDWNTPAHWAIYDDSTTPPDWRPATTGEYPQDLDTAIIQPGHTATIDQAETTSFLDVRADGTVVTAGQTLTVNGEGGLKIQPGGEVNVSAASGVLLLSGGGEHTVNGMISLADDDGASTLRVTASSVFGGDGRIEGADRNNSLIEVEGASVQLASEIFITGSLTITENTTGGIFVNKGVVDPVNGTIYIDQVTLQDGMDGVYRLSESGELRFVENLVSALNLQSDLELFGSGTINIRKDFATTGDFVYEPANAGTLDTDHAELDVTANFGHAYAR